MFKNRIIETLFDKAQDDKTLQVTEEIQESHREISYAEYKLENFMKNNVKAKYREKLNDLINDNIQAVANYYIEVMKVNYERGYVNCAEIIKTILL